MQHFKDFYDFSNPDFDKIPDISLYMDQLLDYLDQMLRSIKRIETDPIYTKTMINNYVKAGQITPPIKKKYSKDTLVDLIAFYHFKQAFSIQDTHAILNQIKEAKPAEQYYTEFTHIYNSQKDHLPTINLEDLSVEEAKTLMLNFATDCVLKKTLCEQLLDFIQQKDSEFVDK